MSIRTSIIFTLVMSILQALLQLDPHAAPWLKQTAPFIQLLLESLKGLRTHYYNTDGTPQHVQGRLLEPLREQD
jgi:hypothetical protein